MSKDEILRQLSQEVDTYLESLLDEDGLPTHEATTWDFISAAYTAYSTRAVEWDRIGDEQAILEEYQDS